MIVKKIWFKNNGISKSHAKVNVKFEGWYLFGVIPIYIRMVY